MEMKIPAIAITAFVVIVVLAGVLMPILDDATAKTDTLKNDGLYFMDEYDDTLSTTISWDRTTPEKITVGSDVITLSKTGSISYTLLCTEDFILRYTYTSASNASLQAWAEDWGSSQYQASVYNSTNMTITIASGTITLDNGSGTTKTYTYTDGLYAISKTGDYVMKSSGTPAHVNYDTSIILGAGRSSMGGSLNLWISGTLKDGFTIGNTYGDNISPTFSDITYTATKDNGYVDLYDFEKMEFTATTAGTDYDIVYSQVIVPYEVTVERAVHFDDNENAIFAAIPIMVIVALLIAVVALVFRGRNF